MDRWSNREDETVLCRLTYALIIDLSKNHWVRWLLMARVLLYDKPPEPAGIMESPFEDGAG